MLQDECLTPFYLSPTQNILPFTQLVLKLVVCAVASGFTFLRKLASSNESRVQTRADSESDSESEAAMTATDSEAAQSVTVAAGLGPS